MMVTSFGAGGYLAGRMRRRAADTSAPEVEPRDGAHGLMVCASGAPFGSVLAALGAGGLLGLGASAVGPAADLATEVADSEYFANVMLRGRDTPATAELETVRLAQPRGEVLEFDLVPNRSASTSRPTVRRC